MRRARILLADDHAVVLLGLRRIIENAGFEVVGAVREGRALVAAAAQLEPDLMVVDVSMPLLNGIEAAYQIRRRNPRARILFLSMHPEAQYAVEAIKAGGGGYLVKSADAGELLTAIRQVLRGKTYVSPALEDAVQHRLRAPRLRARPAAALPARQREVLQLLAEGKSAKEAAALLAVSSRTIEYHKYRLMETLGIRTVAGLAAFAAKHRVIG